MELNQLKSFCAVVENKSFSKAGRAIHLSQPTVSIQINSLERDLGTRLLDRQGRQVTITRGGEVLYHYARRILQLTDEAEEALEQLKGLVRGTLTIGASTIPGEYILPGLLADFKATYPGIDINLVIGDTMGILQKVMDNEVEIGVVGTRGKNKNLVFDRFTTEKLVLIAPANCSWFRGETVTVGELKEAPFIAREGGSGTRATVKQKLHEAGLKEEDLNVVMMLGSTAAVKKAVESGAGVSFISEKAIQNEINLGSIRKLPIKDLRLDRDFFIVSRRQRSPSPATKALLQFLKKKRG